MNLKKKKKDKDNGIACLYLSQNVKIKEGQMSCEH